MSADKRLIGIRLRQSREEPPFWSRAKMARLLQLAAPELGYPELPGIESLTRMIKDWESGKYIPSPPYRALYAHALGRSESELFGSTATQAAVKPIDDDAWISLSNHLATIDILALAWMLGRLNQHMDRRDIIQLAASLTVAPALGAADPIERIAHALTRPTGLTQDLVEYLEARSIGFHQLEPVLPASQIFRGLLAHLNDITTLLQVCPKDKLRTRLARTAGETAVLGAWVAWDLGEARRAAALYRTAELAARESNDHAIIACSTIYQSFALADAGKHRIARQRLADARQALPRHDDPATGAWLLGREAEETAALGDLAAKNMIERASDLLTHARPMPERRSWTRCLESSYLDYLRLRIATGLADKASIYKYIGDLTALVGEPVRKRTGGRLASIGLALVTIGDVHEGINAGQRSLEAVNTTQARYALVPLTQLGAALTGTSSQERDLRQGIRATRQRLLSPHPPRQIGAKPQADRG
jgi:hypothetical protein